MQKKKGISLIVLVITIIVMIILAATIILAINNNNVVDKAKDAVTDTNYKQVQELAQVAWAEGYIAGKKTQEELETYVKEALINSGMSQAELNKYTITVTTTGVTVTKDGNTSAPIEPEVPEEPVAQDIWKVYNLYETLDSNAYYTATFIKIESIYRQYTLKEYKEKYILKAVATEEGTEISDSVTLDDYVLVKLGVSTMEEALALKEESTGTAVTRDELVYIHILGLESTDVDAALESMGYVVADIEAEYNNLDQAEVPTKCANKTYTITLPDGTTETVLGSELISYVKRYAVAANGSYEVKILDETEVETEAFTFNITKCVSATYEDDYYTYTFAEDGYKVVVKDKTLTTYGAILETIDGLPVKYMINTFANCSKLTTAPTIPSGVTNMEYAFLFCQKLTKAPAIPEGVTNMHGTFTYCTSLTVAPTLPSTLINMSAVFQACSGITTAPTIPDGVTDISYAFNGWTKLTKAPVIPKSVTNMKSTFSGCTSLTTAPVIPENVTNMSNTFYKCTSLTKAPTIPSGVTNMYSTFQYCEKITIAPTIPEGVVDLSHTFNSCTNLTTASVIPSSVTNMNGTFASCEKLKAAPAIPYGVKNMDRTFEGCELITTAPTIPNSVTNMSRTFEGCTNLTTTPTIPEGVTDLTRTFFMCSNLTTAPSIPNSVTIMDQTFCRSGITEAPVIPNGVIDMQETFSQTSITTAPTIPASVTNLTETFAYCGKIEGILQINSTKLEPPSIVSDGATGAFSLTGRSGSGLTVVVPNDAVRELLIKDSGYDSTYVTIVKELT